MHLESCVLTMASPFYWEFWKVNLKLKKKKKSAFWLFLFTESFKSDASYCNCAEGESAAVLLQVLSPALQLLILKWQIH